MKLEKKFTEKESTKLYRLVFEHFCRNYDWYLVGTSKSKLVFMEKDYNNMNICFYLHGGKIHWGKKFFDDVIVKYTGNSNLGEYRDYLKLVVNNFFVSSRGWRLFEAGAWDCVNYSECIISRSDKFIFADREKVPYVRDIPK